MSNPIHTIQSTLVDEIKKIPIVKNSIAESGAIPVHLWRGSNLTNELEAALKRIGFGIVVKCRGFNLVQPKHWQGEVAIEIQLNDNFNFSEWGKGVEGMTVAWDIANMMENFDQLMTTSPFRAINVQQQESQQKHIEKILITARIEWAT